MRARPKSASLICPPLVTRMFWGFRSRWTTRCECRKSSPWSSWYIISWKNNKTEGERASRVSFSEHHKDRIRTGNLMGDDSLSESIFTILQFMFRVINDIAMLTWIRRKRNTLTGCSWFKYYKQVLEWFNLNWWIWLTRSDGFCFLHVHNDLISLESK